jgi:hypothetical protein
MMLSSFYQKESFIADRRIRKCNPKVYALWRNRVVKFLGHCDGQHVFLIRDIAQCHYDGFIAHLAKDSRPSTLRDWKYALASFSSGRILISAFRPAPKSSRKSGAAAPAQGF